MGVMLEGRWLPEDPAPETAADGEFRRARTTIRNRITADGAGDFPAEPGRYHLYVAWNCPWAHRALLARAILGLEDAITVSVALPRRTADGWVFGAEGYADTLFGTAALHEVYTRTAPGFTGRVTVPLLVDRETGRAVSNESADIVRMLGAF
ncbi:MAG: glutathione-dependent reductase, partial [Pseudomonadota bacterium]